MAAEDWAFGESICDETIAAVTTGVSSITAEPTAVVAADPPTADSKKAKGALHPLEGAGEGNPAHRRAATPAGNADSRDG